MRDGDKAALGIAAAFGLPWIVVGMSTEVIPPESVVAVIAMGSVGALTLWGRRALSEIRAYAEGRSTR